MTDIPDLAIEPIVRAALFEDLGRGGDVSAALVAPETVLDTVFRARKSGIVAGLACARVACTLLDPRLSFKPVIGDGARVQEGEVLATLSGPGRSVLSVERTALNFLTMLSGVASLTGRFVAAVDGTGAQIAATRKTLPGLRALQKEAVQRGGGLPHRFGLDDAILLKDNHIAAAGSVGAALSAARAVAGHMRVVAVEVDSLAQLHDALPFHPDAVLLDNFTLQDLRQAVKIAGDVVTLEASGGVNLDTVRPIAETGVDVISVGALTHSAAALDIGLDVA